MSRVLAVLGLLVPLGAGAQSLRTVTTAGRFFCDVTRPEVVITAPADGASLTGTRQLSGTATDDTAVQNVTLTVSGVAVNGAVVSPFTLTPVCAACLGPGFAGLPWEGPKSVDWSATFDSTKFPNGSYTLAVTVFDTSKNPSLHQSRDFGVWNPPLVGVTDPLEGARVKGGTVILDGWAQDSVAVQSISLTLSYSSGGAVPLTLTPTCTGCPTAAHVSWSAIFDSTAGYTPDGFYTLHATALDTSNIFFTFDRTFEVHNAPPILSIDPPGGASPLSGAVAISGSVSDAQAIFASLAVSIDGEPPFFIPVVRNGNAWSANLDTTDWEDGYHALTIQGMDATGVAASTASSISATTANAQTTCPAPVPCNHQGHAVDLSLTPVATLSDNNHYVFYGGQAIPLLGYSNEYTCHIQRPGDLGAAYCSLDNYSATVLPMLAARRNNVIREWTVFNHSPGLGLQGKPYDNEQPFKYTGKTVSVTTFAAVQSTRTVSVTTSVAHGLQQGDAVGIAGAAKSCYNGAFTVATVPTATQFTYRYSENVPCGDSAGGGSIKATNPKWEWRSLDTKMLENLQAVACEAYNNDIIVDLTLLDPWDGLFAGGPFGPNNATDNGVNSPGYSAEEGFLKPARTNSAPMAAERRAVQAVVACLKKYPNVIWEVANEPDYKASAQRTDIDAVQQSVIDKWIRPIEAASPTSTPHLIMINGHASAPAPTTFAWHFQDSSANKARIEAAHYSRSKDNQLFIDHYQSAAPQLYGALDVLGDPNLADDRASYVIGFNENRDIANTIMSGTNRGNSHGDDARPEAWEFAFAGGGVFVGYSTNQQNDSSKSASTELQHLFSFLKPQYCSLHSVNCVTANGGAPSGISDLDSLRDLSCNTASSYCGVERSDGSQIIYADRIQAADHEHCTLQGASGPNDGFDSQQAKTYWTAFTSGGGYGSDFAVYLHHAVAEDRGWYHGVLCVPTTSGDPAAGYITTPKLRVLVDTCVYESWLTPKTGAIVTSQVYLMSANQWYSFQAPPHYLQDIVAWVHVVNRGGCPGAIGGH